MNEFTPEEVHNGRQEYARRKATPSNKMRFKANDNRIIYHRHFDGRDE
jgi:hypothetical protein